MADSFPLNFHSGSPLLTLAFVSFTVSWLNIWQKAITGSLFNWNWNSEEVLRNWKWFSKVLLNCPNTAEGWLCSPLPFTLSTDSWLEYWFSVKCFVRFSGVTEESLRGVSTTIREVQAVLLSMIHKDTILVGHSLESDLKATKVIWNSKWFDLEVINSVKIFPLNC